tara:strand:+ start:119 stop:748 length:630 start_codon:yes stop_codon:yes gene_type:complete
MSIKNSTFADFENTEIKTVTSAYALQGKADAASDAALAAWEKVVAMLNKRGIKIDYLKNPTSGLGPIDGHHVDVRNFITKGLLLPINAEDPQGLLEFISDDEAKGKQEREFTVRFNGKMKAVKRTKQQWQSFVRDLPKNLHAKIKRAEPKENGASKRTNDTFTLLGKKIDAAITHVQKLNPEKDESIAGLDLVAIRLGLETAKNHLIQK